jgi:CheY-like chemotaxis protein
MGRHILVVEDEPAVRYTLSLAFRMSGYEVSQAGNGEEALSLILKAAEDDTLFDLLLIDINMPRMNGEELVGELLKREIFLPTIVVTQSRDMDLIDRLLAKGCIDYFFKPYNAQTLVTRVREVLDAASLQIVLPRSAKDRVTRFQSHGSRKHRKSDEGQRTPDQSPHHHRQIDDDQDEWRSAGKKVISIEYLRSRKSANKTKSSGSLLSSGG